MNREELEHKLEQAKADRDKLAVEVERLQAQLAEDKAELRHGDYGLESTNPRLFCGEEMYGVSGRRGSAYPKNRIKEKLGNIFDDLKALAEPIEEFEIGGIQASVTQVFFQDEGCLVIRDSSDEEEVYISPEDIHDFILQLRRVEAYQLGSRK